MKKMYQMGRQIAVACLACWLCSLTVFAENVEDIQYQAYLAMVNADNERDEGNADAARTYYEEAISHYMNLRQVDPRFKPEIVEYRITYCRNQIHALGGGSPAPTPPVANRSPSVDDSSNALRQQIADLQMRLAKAEQSAKTNDGSSDAVQQQLGDLQKRLADAEMGEAESNQRVVALQNKLDELRNSMGMTQGGSDQVVALQEQLAGKEAAIIALRMQLKEQAMAAGSNTDQSEAMQSLQHEKQRLEELLADAGKKARQREAEFMNDQAQLSNSLLQMEEQARTSEHQLRQELAAARAEVDAISSRMKDRLNQNQGNASALAEQLEVMDAALAIAQQKAEDAEGRMAATEEESNARLASANDELQTVKKQLTAMESRAEKQAEELQVAQAEYNLLSQKLDKAQDGQKSKLQSLEEALTAAEETHREAVALLEQEVAEVRGQMKEAMAANEQQIDAARQEANSSTDQLKQQLADTLEKLRMADSEKADVQGSLDDLNAQTETYRQKLKMAADKIKEYKAFSEKQRNTHNGKIQALIQEVDQANRMNDNLKSEIQALQRQMQDATSASRELELKEEALQALGVQLNQTRDERDTLNKQVEELLSRLQQAEQAMTVFREETQGSQTQLMQQLKALQAERKTLLSKQKEQAQALTSSMERIPQLEKEVIEPLRGKVTTLEERVQNLTMLAKKKSDDLTKTKDEKKVLQARVTKAEQALETQNELLKQANDTAAQYSGYVEEYQKAKGLITEYADTAHQWKKAHEELQAEFITQGNLNKTLQARIDGLEETRDDMRSQNRSHLDAIKESMAQLKIVNEEKNALEVTLEEYEASAANALQARAWAEQDLGQFETKFGALTNELAVLSEKLMGAQKTNMQLTQNLTSLQEEKTQWASNTEAAKKEAGFLQLRLEEAQAENQLLSRQQMDLIRQVKALLGEMPGGAPEARSGGSQ